MVEFVFDIPQQDRTLANSTFPQQNYLESLQFRSSSVVHNPINKVQ